MRFSSHSMLEISILFACRREDSLDVEISASGFTKEMEDNFDEVSMKIQELSVVFAIHNSKYL